MIFPFLVLTFWLVGACIRVYRQARFFQIEEYMPRRYGRWVLSERERALPLRPLAAFFGGAALSFIFSEAPTDLVPFIISAIAAVTASIPPSEGEIKRKFRATARAKRLLFASWMVIILLGLILFFAITPALSRVDNLLPLLAAGLIGLIAHLLAPAALIAGSGLMQPVEALFRRRYLAQARRVLEETHPTVIGITGSYGKTTTKVYIAHFLNARYKAYATPKSYNTLMGISMAINNDLAQDRSIDYFIAEMGAYIPGEIERLCDLTHPTIGVIVEVGPQHLERFGSLENTAIAKYELIKALPPDGVGVFNWDNPYVREMAQRGHPATRLTVSRMTPPDTAADDPRFIADNISESLDGLRFTLRDRKTGESALIETPLLGIHNVTNILLAAAVAVHEGIPLRDIARRARMLQPAESRLVRQTTAAGITILNDAYSANPAGVVSALRTLGLHQTGRRLLITPGMVELGPLMDQENRKLGEIAAQHATDVILVGRERTAPIREGLISAGFDEARLRTVDTLSEAVSWYQTHLQAGDTVLFLNDLPDTYAS